MLLIQDHNVIHNNLDYVCCKKHFLFWTWVTNWAKYCKFGGSLTPCSGAKFWLAVSDLNLLHVNLINLKNIGHAGDGL